MQIICSRNERIYDDFNSVGRYYLFKFYILITYGPWKNIDIDVQFRRHDDITSLTNETDSKDTSSSNVVVKAFNYSTGNYDAIFANGATEIKGDRFRKYLQNGEIKLRFISPHQGSEYTEVYLPRISARGGGD